MRLYGVHFTGFGWLLALWMFGGMVGLQAQEASPFEAFDVMILPEYEHPGIEVQVEGRVKPGQYPRYLEMDVPPTTRIALLAKLNPQGEPVSERIETQQRDGRTYLPLDINESQFSVRYFFNPFEAEGTERSFEYVLTVNDPLSEFHIIIQEPVAARNFVHSLESADRQEGEFDLIYYRQHIHGLQPGTGHTVSISYENPTNTLTMAELQARMAQRQAEGGTASAAANGKPSNLAIVGVVFLFLAVALFLILKIQGRQKAGASAAPATEAPHTKPVKPGTGKAGGGEFCSACGARKCPDTHFCPNCGKEF